MKPDDRDYFSLFSLAADFRVDMEQLSAAYRELQSRFHPDRFAQGSERERLAAVQQASLLNEAYETLRSTRRRAAYLLAQRGVDLERVNQSDLSPGLLLEQIRLREELEEIPRDESSLATLERLRTRVEDRLGACERSFELAMAQGDLPQAKQVYFEMLYLSKLVSEVEAVEEDLLGF